MAIVFDCPHCKTNYKLKDDVGGKTATCKNPNCRKVINIPMPKKPVAVAAPADLDAFAAAAFADDPAAKPVAEEMLPVTCAKCDHHWQVEASKEGKNVLCPECRHPNRVPPRKKEEKIDWKTGGGGPSGRKRETGDNQFIQNVTTGIGDETARAIVKERDAQEEPEERRKRRLKIAGYSFLGIAVVGTAVFFGMRARNEVKSDARMEDAVKEVEAEAPKNDYRYKALIHRAAAEHGIRTANGDKESKAALDDFKLARNSLGNAPGLGFDRNIILGDIAVSMADMLGTPDEVQDGKRIKHEDVVKEVRVTLQRISPNETELLADVVRGLTGKFAAKGHAGALEGIIMQLGQNAPELLGQMALELLRLDKGAHQGIAEKVLKTPGAETNPSLVAVRLALGKAPPEPKTPPAPGKKNVPPPEPLRAKVESEVLKGNAGAAKDLARKQGSRDERPWVLTAGGMAALESSPTEAAEMLTEAAELLEKNSSPATPWVAMRVCRGLGKLGKFDPADKLANSLTDEQAKAWAKLEVVRGRLAAKKGEKADDSWLDQVGDPTKLGAAIKAREEVARHNAANGQSYDATVKGWPKGTARPFGLAGIVLGQDDRR
jgi:hypothetical protein